MYTLTDGICVVFEVELNYHYNM